MVIKSLLTSVMAVASISGMSFAVQAQESAFEKRVNESKDTSFSYRWIELDYVTRGDDNYSNDRDADGFRVDFSVPVIDQFSVIGDLTTYSNKYVDTLKLSGGTSYHLNIGSLSTVTALDKMDGVIHAEIEYYNPDCKGCDTEVGLYTGLEARYWAADGLEVYADLSIRTAYNNNLFFSGGVRWAALDTIQLTAGFTLADADELYIGGRFNF